MKIKNLIKTSNKIKHCMFYRYLVFHILDIELCCQCIHIDQPKYKVPFQWKCFLYNHVSIIHQALSHSEI